MEDDLNCKAVLLRLFNNNKPQKQMVLTPQRLTQLRTKISDLSDTTLNQEKYLQHCRNASGYENFQIYIVTENKSVDLKFYICIHFPIYGAELSKTNYQKVEC